MCCSWDRCLEDFVHRDDKSTEELGESLREGIKLVEVPERMEIATAIVGVIITYITDGMPQQVEVGIVGPQHMHRQRPFIENPQPFQVRNRTA